MKRFVLILIAFLSFLNSYSQNNSPEQLYLIVNEYTAKLKSKNIDTICIYRDYYRGIQGKSDYGEPCTYEDIFIPTYIFWKEKNKTYVTQKDNCFDFETFEIQNDDFWNIIFKNIKIIIKEENKRFELINQKSKEKLHRSVSHSHFRRFELFLNNYTCEKSFDDFDLIEYDHDNLNLNYKYNNLLKSKLLIDELEKIVNELKSKNLFINKIKRL